jgi:hypothetical protein
MARLNEVTIPAPDSGSRVDAASFRAALGHFCTGVLHYRLPFTLQADRRLGERSPCLLHH